MKKVVLTFGLISGAILSAMMAISMLFHDAIGFDTAMVVGYTTMVIAFLLVYFGVRTYRDNVAGGTVRFGRAFVIGMLITTIATVCYAATWQVISSTWMPDYFEKYSAHIIDKERQKGSSEAVIAAKKAEMDKYAEMYKNPALVFAFTLLEPLPVAVIVSLVTAGVLSRRRREATDEVAIGAGIRT